MINWHGAGEVARNFPARLIVIELHWQVRRTVIETLDLFEIALILAIALIVVGPERLPEVMRTVGKILRELRLASNTVLHELTEVLDEPPASAPASKATTPAATQPAAPKSEPPAPIQPPENT